MKTRNGFISNSSSCSFFLKPDKFLSTKEVTWYMLERRIECFEEHLKDEFEWLDRVDTLRVDKKQIEDTKQHIKELEERLHKQKADNKTMLKNMEDVDDNENLAFCSYNYDTYIRRINLQDINGTEHSPESGYELPDENLTYVSTCNNIQWYPIQYPWENDSYVPTGLHHGDIHDGLFDHVFVEEHKFLVLDYMKHIKIVYNERDEGEPGTHYIYASLKDTFENKGNE